MKLTYYQNHSSKSTINPQNAQRTVVVKPKKVKIQCKGTLYVIDQRYSDLKFINNGAYGCVSSAMDNKTQKRVAIKKVISAFQDLVDGKRILRQIRLLKFLKHPNIISLIEVDLPEKKNFEDVYIVTELMETDLHRVIYTPSKQKLTEDHVKHFLHQCLKGLNYMHSANIMHRDLKPSNLLVNKDCTLKICDLGLARGFIDEEEGDKTQYVVTRYYRAPEVILKASEYTKAIDVWSVGCIFAELLGKNPLFPGKDYLEQIQRIISIVGTPSLEDQKFIVSQSALKYIKSLPKRTKQNWKNLYPSTSDSGLDLLDKMLTFNPDKRYSVEQCLSHPFFEEEYGDSLQKSDYAPKVYDWTIDNFQLTKENLQQMIYKEALRGKK